MATRKDSVGHGHRMATFACSVDMHEIAMLGKWSNEHMIKSYVNGVPVAAVLVRAGHDPTLHLLPRSTVEPDQELLDKIFPGVEKLLQDKKAVCWQLHAWLHGL